jgi:hypothetical protein
LNTISATGLGIALVLFFFRYLFKDLPPWIAWPGIAIGLLMVAWGQLSPMHISKLGSSRVSPTAWASIGFLLVACGVAAGWYAYSLYRDGWPLKWIWGSFINADRDQKSGQIKVWGFEGIVENVSSNEVKLEEAFIVSRMNGRRVAIMLNDRYGAYGPVQQFNSFPPGSRVDFRALFKTETDAMSESDFWASWGGIEFVAKYAGREYRKEFSVDDAKNALAFYRPEPPPPYPSTTKP